MHIIYYIKLFKTDNITAEKIVGITKFFLVKIKIKIQLISTTNLIKRSEPDKTPAGKIIILPSNAANVEYATQLNHWNTFDWTLTFSEVIAPKNLDF